MPLLHLNGVEMHYHIQGKGTPIVFLHAAVIGSRVFTYLRNDLARDHRTLLFDQRGHGRSASSSARLTIPLMAEDTLRMMDALDIRKAYLFAYSMGSLVALEALLAHPDRFLGAVLLSGMPAAGGGGVRWLAKAGAAAAALRAREALSLSESWIHADSPETFYRLRNEAKAGDPAKWRDFLTSALEYSAVKRLRDIRLPVLLLYGQRDRFFVPYARLFQEGLPNSSTAWIPDAWHTLPIHAAGPCGQLARGWINALEGRRTVEAAGGEGRLWRTEYRSDAIADPDEFAYPLH